MGWGFASHFPAEMGHGAGGAAPADDREGGFPEMSQDLPAILRFAFSRGAEIVAGKKFPGGWKRLPGAGRVF